MGLPPPPHLCESLRIQGEVAFNRQTGDRIAWTKLEQLQDGAYVEVALHDQRTDNLTWLSR